MSQPEPLPCAAEWIRLPSTLSEQRSISPDEMFDLPIRRYDGAVYLVSSQQDRERALADIRTESVVGFDTETRPAFRKGESYLPCLAQVATARAVYLFQLQQQDFSAEMRELLASERVAKAGVALANDLRGLKKLIEFDARSIVDLDRVARHHGFKQPGVRNLAGLLLGFRIPKGTKTSNWAARQLSPQQILYAATDAWACRELYLRFCELRLV